MVLLWNENIMLKIFSVLISIGLLLGNVDAYAENRKKEDQTGVISRERICEHMVYEDPLVTALPRKKDELATYSAKSIAKGVVTLLLGAGTIGYLVKKFWPYARLSKSPTLHEQLGVSALQSPKTGGSSQKPSPAWKGGAHFFGGGQNSGLANALTRSSAPTVELLSQLAESAIQDKTQMSSWPEMEQLGQEIQQLHEQQEEAQRRHQEELEEALAAVTELQSSVMGLRIALAAALEKQREIQVKCDEKLASLREENNQIFLGLLETLLKSAAQNRKASLETLLEVVPGLQSMLQARLDCGDETDEAEDESKLEILSRSTLEVLKTAAMEQGAAEDSFIWESEFSQNSDDSMVANRSFRDQKISGLLRALHEARVFLKKRIEVGLYTEGREVIQEISFHFPKNEVASRLERSMQVLDQSFSSAVEGATSSETSNPEDAIGMMVENLEQGLALLEEALRSEEGDSEDDDELSTDFSSGYQSLAQSTPRKPASPRVVDFVGRVDVGTQTESEVQALLESGIEMKGQQPSGATAKKRLSKKEQLKALAQKAREIMKKCKKVTPSHLQ